MGDVKVCQPSKMENWPNKVNAYPVSTTTSPVIVMVEIVVKKASIQEIKVVVVIGSFNKYVQWLG